MKSIIVGSNTREAAKRILEESSHEGVPVIPITPELEAALTEIARVYAAIEGASVVDSVLTSTPITV